MSYQRTVVAQSCCPKSTSQLLSLGHCLPLDRSILLIYHLYHLGLVAVGQEIMRGVYVLQTLFIVLPSLVVDVFVFFLHFQRVNGHAIYEVLSIGSIVFWEIHIDKASEGMAISSNSDNPILISMAINNLLLQSSSLVTRTYILAILGIDCIAIEDSLFLINIELLDCLFLLLLNFCLVLCLQFAYLCIMALFEAEVLLHYTIHVTIINVHHYHFLSFLKCLVLILQSKFLRKLLLKPSPFVLLIQLCSTSIVNCCLMGLVIFWFVPFCMGIHIEGFLMITINDSSDCIFDVSSAVGLECSFVEIVLILSIGQGTGIWFESLEILLHFLSSLLLPFSLLFKLFLSNTLSQLGIQFFLLTFFVSCTC